jgi:GT2 family glycosyltransferase
VDADCELVPGWLGQASAALESPVAVVFGRRRERHREASIYNRLCDLDWDKPVGEARECGGDALIRTDAFRQAGGYNPALIAGEEPELCVRLRQNHGKILCIAAEMTIHDARMVSFVQWWKRAVRSGHAYAEGSWMHGMGGDRHWLRQTLSVWFWGGALPLAAVLLAIRKPWAGVWTAALYVALGLRVFVRERSVRTNISGGDALAYAVFCVLGKLPQALGQARFVAGKWSRRPSGLIEYKPT